MTKHDLQNSFYYQSSVDEAFFLTHPPELISDEQRPSLCSHSITESLLSHSSTGINTEQMTQPYTEPSLSYHNQNAIEDTTLHSCKNEDSGESDCMMKSVRKCKSLHDVSNISHSRLMPKSVNTNNTISSETIHSQSLSSTTKSKDSGFHRSASCLSLTSGRRNYDHVESKVKAYIRNIKETEALRKKKKLEQQSESIEAEQLNPDECIADFESDINLNKEDLLYKLQELKLQLHEQSLYIDVQKQNYNSLLLKYAEAKNTIDALRLQRISLDYTSLNETQNKLLRNDQSIDFDVFIRGVNNNFSHRTEPIKQYSGERSSLENHSKPEHFCNVSITKVFSPRNHSTPEKSSGTCKILSPVSKLTSGSFRLDRNFKPLVGIRKEEKQLNISDRILSKSCNRPMIIESTELQTNTPNKSKTFEIRGLMNNRRVFDKNQPVNEFNLPNEDPFVKVKKWQASLPNINLLASCTSSDQEITCSGNKEEDITTLLSHELVNKCKISEIENNPSNQIQPRQNCIKQNCKILSNTTTERKQNLNYDLSARRRKNHGKSNKNLKLNCSLVKPSYFRTEKRRLNGIISNLSLRRNLENLSLSEDESESCTPRSSCESHKVSRKGSRDLSDSSEDSSTSHHKKHCFGLEIRPRIALENTTNCSNKTPISCPNNKTTESKFVLRKPTLQVPFEKLSKLIPQKHVDNLNIPTVYPQPSVLNLSTESTQRKAWNARNSANFFVCKDFHLKKSNSIQNCITVMEEMMRKSSRIIHNGLSRNIFK